jgi:hypothetical protein
MSECLTRKQFLEASRPAPERYEIAGMGIDGAVGIRVMTALERDRLGVVRYGVGDLEGKPLFTDSDVVALSGMSGLLVDKLVAEVVRVNRMGNEAIEDAAKNSASVPSEG